MRRPRVSASGHALYEARLSVDAGWDRKSDLRGMSDLGRRHSPRRGQEYTLWATLVAAIRNRINQLTRNMTLVWISIFQSSFAKAFGLWGSLPPDHGEWGQPVDGSVQGTQGLDVEFH